MAYVITAKCADECYAACVDVCPVDCIHPVPFKDTTVPEGQENKLKNLEGKPFMVIDPDPCINCGICLPECPINAIVATEEEDPAAAKINLDLTPAAIEWERLHGKAPTRPPNDPPHRPDNKVR